MASSFSLAEWLAASCWLLKLVICRGAWMWGLVLWLLGNLLTMHWHCGSLYWLAYGSGPCDSDSKYEYDSDSLLPLRLLLLFWCLLRKRTLTRIHIHVQVATAAFTATESRSSLLLAVFIHIFSSPVLRRLFNINLVQF